MSERSRPRRVLFVGPPNAGKSTLFNRLTGAAAHVGNYPGITVDQYHAPLRLDGSVADAIDLPGAYSLAARSPEERITLDAILGRDQPRADLVVAVVDTPRLTRSLYLVLQILEMQAPCVVALNLMDEAEASGRTPSVEAVAAALGVPCVPVVARTGQGLDELSAVISAALDDPSIAITPPLYEWSEALQSDVDAVVAALPEEITSAVEDDPERARAVARWMLLSLGNDDTLAGDEHLPQDVVRQRLDAARAQGRDVEQELVARRYRWLDARAPAFLGEAVDTGPDPSDKIDRWLLHPLVGVPLFFVVMALVFTALFSWADPVIGLIEQIVGLVGDGVRAGLDVVVAQVGAVSPVSGDALSLASDLIVDGIIGGVGAVVVFVPQIALLSLFIAVLEDSGYLARAAYLMDRVLRMAGLPGRAFVPLLSGFACAVPAIQATRTLPRFRDRLLTMMVIPLTSCSARLPVYTLLIAALFPVTLAGSMIPVRPIALFAMYLFSTAVTVIAAVVLGRTVVRDTATPTIIELPPWRMPSVGQVLRVTWRRTYSFLREAGGIILVATVVLWALLSFPRYQPESLVPPDEAAQLEQAGRDVASVAQGRALERSFGGQLGRAIEPAIAPLGFDWRVGVGLIGSFAAREVFVSTMGIVYQVGDVDETSNDLRQRIRSATRPDGTTQYTPLVGLALMVFFALAMQCTSTLAVLKRESGGWRWPVFVFVWLTATAWIGAFVVYQGGRLLGFS